MAFVMTWLTHPRSSTLHLAQGYTCQVNRVPDHHGPERWRARALGQPVDGEWGTRKEAEEAAVTAAWERAAVVLLAVGWPDDGAAAKALTVERGHEGWKFSDAETKIRHMRAALTAALKEAAGE